jgi:hypothetical protein
MKPSKVSAIRTRLRNVNVEYSALVRNVSEHRRSFRMAQLRTERAGLMALLAGEGVAATEGLLRVVPGQQHSTPQLSLQHSDGSPRTVTVGQ